MSNEKQIAKALTERLDSLRGEMSFAAQEFIEDLASDSIMVTRLTATQIRWLHSLYDQYVKGTKWKGKS